MKTIFCCLIVLLSFTVKAQRKRAVEISGTEYVVVQFQDYSKYGMKPSGLKFINSENGKANVITFDDETSIKDVEHIKIDLLNIDVVLVITAKTEKKNSAYSIESKILIYSHDGTLKNSLMLDREISDHIVSQKTGRIVLVLSANRFMSPKTEDQSEVVYDLKTLKKVG